MDPVTAIRLPEDLKSAIETWAAKQDPVPSRSEAIRSILTEFLNKKGLLASR